MLGRLVRPPPPKVDAPASRSPYGGAVRVQEIWRFPVKSMQGERIDAAEVEPQGLRGDRAFALFDTRTGFGLTGRRVPQLLFAAAVYRDDGRVTITLRYDGQRRPSAVGLVGPAGHPTDGG